MRKTERKVGEREPQVTADQLAMLICLLECAYDRLAASNDEGCQQWLGVAYGLLVELGRPVQPVRWGWDENCFRVMAP